MKLEKGEKKLRNLGLNIPMPINSLLLFTSAENDILNIIRHYTCFEQKYISDNLIRICTGRDKKAIKRAKDSLIKMKIIKITALTRKGTVYEINFEKLCSIIRKLNNERNAFKRIKIANEFRGEKLKLHKKLEEEYEFSNFNNTL